MLLVEDEPSVRSLAVQVLQKQGYRVLDAENGSAALAVARASNTPIHLLISDVVMPGQSGPELAAELLRQRPDLKILFISGYTDSRLADPNRFATSAFLQKPFTPTVLAQRVRQVLESAVVA